METGDELDGSELEGIELNDSIFVSGVFDGAMRAAVAAVADAGDAVDTDGADAGEAVSAAGTARGFGTRCGAEAVRLEESSRKSARISSRGARRCAFTSRSKPSSR